MSSLSNTLVQFYALDRFYINRSRFSSRPFGTFVGDEDDNPETSTSMHVDPQPVETSPHVWHDRRRRA